MSQLIVNFDPAKHPIDNQEMKDTFKVYVVEDNEWYQKMLVHTLELNPAIEVTAFGDGKSLLKALASKPDLITLDYRLPDTTGDLLLRKILERHNEVPVVVVSEQDEIETAVELLKAGAYDYLIKSDQIKSRIHNIINHLKKTQALENRVEILEKEVQRKFDFSTTLKARSRSMKDVLAMIEKAINSVITVSITGETGTGKEVVAKTIHYNSAQRTGPFVAVNMAAIPTELMESELFGHEQGAFTGANTKRIGKFEEADNGTLFLDEIAEMDITLQAKLLRALQEREITRLGGTGVIKFNARIIVATHQNLFDAAQSGTFREDLYYRITGLPITLPPLRDRREDLIDLAQDFCEEFSVLNNVGEKSLHTSATEKLTAHTWPGNIRELRSIIELAVVMSQNKLITADDILINNKSEVNSLFANDMTLREYEIKIVSIFMKRFNNNTKMVASALDIGQTTVYRLLKEGQNDASSTDS